MRARQFLSLQSPIMVEHDGRRVVVLAFTIGLFGRLNAMVVEPTVPSAPRSVPVDRLTFPAAIQAGPVAGSMGGTLGHQPSRAERRAAARDN